MELNIFILYIQLCQTWCMCKNINQQNYDTASCGTAEKIFEPFQPVAEKIPSHQSFLVCNIVKILERCWFLLTPSWRYSVSIKENDVFLLICRNYSRP